MEAVFDVVAYSESDQPSDAELISRYRGGSLAAIDLLVNRHSDVLYRFCCSLLPCRHDAEDVHQETLMRAVTRLSALRDGAAFKPWLFSIARNLAIDTFRGQRWTCSLPEDENAPAMYSQDNLQAEVEAREEQRLIGEALGKLGKRHQTVLILREVHGLSYAAIAQQLKVTDGAVETLLFRARRNLRSAYDQTVRFPMTSASSPSPAFA